MVRVEIGTPRPVVPGPAAVGGVKVLRANNNLDVCDVDGRRYLAWRTAPIHFASANTYLHVVSSTDGGATWEHETTVHLGRDLREPRFFPWRGRLFLYFFALGTTWWKFEPDRVHVIERGPDGSWTAPEPLSDPGVVVWRVRVLGGVPVMSVYKGADTTYAANPEPNTVELWTSDDGRAWQPLDPDHPVAHVGGTETDIVEAPGGGWVAVTRKEGPAGWGSDVCRADEPGPRNWRTRSHPVKLDSPLLFRDGDDVLLIARRQLAFGGRYDLGWSRLSPARRSKAYQGLYWLTRKRTSLWRVDPDTLDVEWLADLPSRGDTCFPAIAAEGDGRYTVYNYTSPLDGFDRPWVLGQFGPTNVHALDLTVHREG